METKTANATKRDVYSIVTDRLIALLQEGTVPWKKPWYQSGLPQNLVTHRTYRGINVLLLSCLGYTTNFFLTSKQLKELGGSIKKDEKPHIVTYWNWIEEQVGEEEKSDEKKVPFLRYYTVFNIEQCDGIPAEKIPVMTRQAYPIPACEDIIVNMQNLPVIKHKENRAYYNPLQDFVNMPKKESFASDETYYGTLFHELIHSTGHASRLHRKGLLDMSEFSTDAYSFEELIAEMGAAYLESLTGIASQQSVEQNAAYIQSWIKRLQGDKKFVVQASVAAQKATDYILNIKRDEAGDETTA